MNAAISTKTFGAFDAVELKTDDICVIAVWSKGPRIAYFGRQPGDNLLFWNPGEIRRAEWDLMGGHRLWVMRPGADETEETYAMDNESCSLEIGHNEFTITTPPDSRSRITRGITVRALRADRLEVEHFLRNDGPLLYSAGLWALTCSRPGPGARYIVPLGDGSPWDTATVVYYRKWGGLDGSFADPQFEFTEDSMILRPSGRQNKRMVRAECGIIAMHDPSRELTFAKHAVFEPDRSYPRDTNLALYVGPKNYSVEMETMGFAREIKPGGQLRHFETWCLTRESTAPSATSLRALSSELSTKRAR